jgi:hypothetical protein
MPISSIKRANRAQGRSFGAVLKPSRHRQHQPVFHSLQGDAPLVQLGGQDSVRPVNAARGSRRGPVSVEQFPHIFARTDEIGLACAVLKVADRAATSPRVLHVRAKTSGWPANFKGLDKTLNLKIYTIMLFPILIYGALGG